VKFFFTYRSMAANLSLYTEFSRITNGSRSCTTAAVLEVPVGDSRIPVDITFLMDSTMNIDRLTLQKEMMRFLLEGTILRSSDTVQLCYFGRPSYVKGSQTDGTVFSKRLTVSNKGKPRLLSFLDSPDMSNVDTSSTNLYCPIKNSINEMRRLETLGGVSRHRIIVLMSNGTITNGPGEEDVSNLVETELRQKNSPIELHVASFGDIEQNMPDFNPSFMENLKWRGSMKIINGLDDVGDLVYNIGEASNSAIQSSQLKVTIDEGTISSFLGNTEGNVLCVNLNNLSHNSKTVVPLSISVSGNNPVNISATFTYGDSSLSESLQITRGNNVPNNSVNIINIAKTMINYNNASDSGVVESFYESLIKESEDLKSEKEVQAILNHVTKQKQRNDRMVSNDHSSRTNTQTNTKMVYRSRMLSNATYSEDCILYLSARGV
jgi:hypothetical protein